jgi:ABC-type transport system involved in multi-copper enzyme maturation permease subunit
MRPLVAAWINELEKLWRHRRLLIGSITAIVLAMAALSALSRPAAGSWQDSERAEIAHMQQALTQAGSSTGPAATARPPALFDLNASLQQGLTLKQYRLDHQLAPVDWYPMSAAAKTVFQLAFPLYLILAGWLAAEALSQERAERTITGLLSLPISRTAILVAKAAAVLTITTAALVLGWALAYIVFGTAHGGWTTVTPDVAILRDPAIAADPSNLLTMPAWTYALASLVLSLLALAAADALGLLVSTFARSAGWSVGTAVAALLLPPGALVVLTLWLRSPAWTQYLVFTHLQPANLLLDQAAPGVPHSSLFMTVAVLAAWTGVMFSVSAAAFRWKDELA